MTNTFHSFRSPRTSYEADTPRPSQRTFQFSSSLRVTHEYRCWTLWRSSGSHHGWCNATPEINRKDRSYLRTLLPSERPIATPSSLAFFALYTRNGSRRIARTYHGWRGLVRTLCGRFVSNSDQPRESLVSKVWITIYAEGPLFNLGYFSILCSRHW